VRKYVSDRSTDREGSWQSKGAASRTA
jgi:hypothetical protein